MAEEYFLNLFSDYAGARTLKGILQNEETNVDIFQVRSDDFIRRALDKITILMHHIAKAYIKKFPFLKSSTEEAFEKEENRFDFATLLSHVTDSILKEHEDHKIIHDEADNVRRNIRNRLAHGGNLSADVATPTEMMETMKTLVNFFRTAFESDDYIRGLCNRAYIGLTDLDCDRLMTFEENMKIVNSVSADDKKLLGGAVCFYLANIEKNNDAAYKTKMYEFLTSVVATRILSKNAPAHNEIPIQRVFLNTNENNN